MKRISLLALAAVTLLAALACADLAGLVGLSPVAQAQAAKSSQTKAKKTEPAAPKVTGVKILEFGIYTSTVVQRIHAASVADGIKDRATDFKLVRKSTLVDARLGTSIGMKYILRGTPKDGHVTIEVGVVHPPMVNPQTHETMTRSSANFERVIGQPEHAVWSFDTQADLVPGDYTIEIVSEGKVLAQKVFRVRIRD